MAYALTTKSQVTVPKAVRLALGVLPGQEIDYEVKPNGQVIMFPVKKPDAQIVNPFLKWRGTGLLKKSTEDILRETRGDDAMR
jgi:antitoxin PrlF